MIATSCDHWKAEIRSNQHERLIADTAYGTGEMLDWLDRQRGIAPHIPVVDKSGRKDGTFERADFTYDAENDSYICPDGKELRQNRRAFSKPRETKPDQDGTPRYRASKADCDACALMPRCCPNTPSRKVTRSIYEPSRDVARAIAQTTQYAISCKLRKKVEMLFAHLKRSRAPPTTDTCGGRAAGIAWVISDIHSWSGSQSGA